MGGSAGCLLNVIKRFSGSVARKLPTVRVTTVNVITVM
jgi:hypothetical protein